MTKLSDRPADGDAHSETATYRETIHKVDRANRRVYFTVILAEAIVIALLIINGFFVQGKVDHQDGVINHLNGVVHDIRKTQQSNTKISRCQADGFNQVLTEIFKEAPITAPRKC